MDEDRIYWHIPERVLYMKGARDATIEQARADGRMLNQLVEVGIAPVHLLLDLSDLGMLPGEGDVTEEMIALISHAKMGRVAVIGLPNAEQPIYQTARDALTQLTGKPIDLVETLAAGLALLREYDETLNA